jgi:pimeloyl-ACP methyl ester carboxylesterase
MARFVLIHGAFHGAWCWRQTVAELEKHGHQAQAIDLPGQGDDTTPLSKVTLESMADCIVTALERSSGRAVLVGHSLGGMAISAAAEKVPERVEALIYVCAFLPREGESLLAIEGRNPKVAVPKSLIVADDGVSGTIMPDRVHNLFYHDCSPADASDSAARLRPQALTPLSTPIHLTTGRFGRVPRAYIECTEDRALVVEMQRDMISKSPPVTVRALPSGHSPFLSMPDRLAQALIELVPTARAS